MRIAFLGSADSWYLRDLQRAAGTRHELVALPFSRLASSVAADRLAVTSPPGDLNGLDAVLVRTMPPGSLEQVVFRMDALAQAEAAGGLVVNPPRAIEVAVDKYLATARLRAAGLRTPETIVCQDVESAVEAFQLLGGDVVLKPLFGSEGRGIARLQDEALAQRTFQLLVQLGAVIYLQRFIPHEGVDLRVLVIGSQVLGMRRRNPQDWRTNISRGAVGEPCVVEEPLAQMAHRAAQAVGATVAGVDILPGRDGLLYTLEVNAVPGWKGLARACRVDVAALVLEHLAELSRRRGPADPDSR